jgi:hypothetical protein
MIRSNRDLDGGNGLITTTLRYLVFAIYDVSSQQRGFFSTHCLSITRGDPDRRSAFGLTEMAVSPIDVVRQ